MNHALCRGMNHHWRGVAYAALIGASAVACSGGASGEGPAESVGTRLASETIDVPSLSCVGPATLNRAEYTVRVEPRLDDAREGTGLVYRYSILDGQRYLVARAAVTATRQDDGVEPLTSVDGGAGSFSLQVKDDGSATLRAVNAVGFPLLLVLECAGAPPQGGGP